MATRIHGALSIVAARGWTRSLFITISYTFSLSLSILFVFNLSLVSVSRRRFFYHYLGEMASKATPVDPAAQQKPAVLIIGGLGASDICTAPTRRQRAAKCAALLLS